MNTPESHLNSNPSPTPQTRGRTIRWAGRYDLVVKLLALGKDRSMRQKTIDMAQIKPGDQVLDVGCGTGDLTLAAKAAAGPTGRVSGIDAASEMIEVARRKAAKAHVEIDFKVDLIERLSFPDNTLDVVLSSLMMHHLPDDLKRAGLAEIYRVLKPGGRLLVVDFKRPTSSLGQMLMPVLMHRSMPSGAQDLPALMAAAGFVQIETGHIWLKVLGFARGVKA